MISSECGIRTVWHIISDQNRIKVGNIKWISLKVLVSGNPKKYIEETRSPLSTYNNLITMDMDIS